MVFPWLKSLDERQKRAIEGNKEDVSVPSVASWLHCSVGGKLEDNEEESDEGKTQVGFVIYYSQTSLIFD